MFWLVAEHGLRCDDVKNLVASPQIEIKVGRRWRRGTATLVPDDATGRLASGSERHAGWW